MEQINVAMISAVLAGIVKQLEAIDGWLTLKTEPVLNGTAGLEFAAAEWDQCEHDFFQVGS